jgi:hypothetical protein
VQGSAPIITKTAEVGMRRTRPLPLPQADRLELTVAVHGCHLGVGHDLDIAIRSMRLSR